MPRALVTGATGFVGRALVQLLSASGWHVVALARPGRSAPESLGAHEVELLTDPSRLGDVLDRTRADTVFHLAAHQARGDSAADIDAFIEANLRLGLHLFAAAGDRDVTVVQTLSYFQFRDGVPAPHSLYAATKQAQATFADYWRTLHGADIRDVVLYDNYGPRDRRDKLVPALLRAVRSGERMTVGPREQIVDLLHVRDVASGLLAAATDERRPTTVVRADGLVTVGAIVDEIGRLAGSAVPVDVDPDRTATDHPARAGVWATPTGWAPTVPLSDGLGECLAAERR